MHERPGTLWPFHSFPKQHIYTTRKIFAHTGQLFPADYVLKEEFSSQCLLKAVQYVACCKESLGKLGARAGQVLIAPFI